MNLWLDDERDPANYGKADWTWVKTALEAINLLKAGNIKNLSLDHDLGTDLTGYDVAAWIEQAAFNKLIPRLNWAVHSANPVGKSRMLAALYSADKFWLANA